MKPGNGMTQEMVTRLMLGWLLRVHVHHKSGEAHGPEYEALMADIGRFLKLAENAISNPDMGGAQ